MTAEEAIDFVEAEFKDPKDDLEKYEKLRTRLQFWINTLNKERLEFDEDTPFWKKKETEQRMKAYAKVWYEMQLIDQGC